MARAANNWHAKSAEDVLAKLNSSIDGLSEDEAKKRLKKFGPNKLPEAKKTTKLKIFIEQFKGPLIIVLLIAGLVSLALQEFVDFGIIIFAILLNTVIGYWQENKANSSLEDLRKMIEPKALVRRGGKEESIPSEGVVPGDIIIIESGSRIAADGRIIESHDFSANEAALTGESMPVSKKEETLEEDTVLAERTDMVYLSTVATRGRAIAVVTNTGIKTELGEIAKLIQQIPEEKTPLQETITHFSKILGIMVGIVCLLIFIVGIIMGESLFEMFFLAVAIAVAAIPEGLLVAVTVTLAIGMQKILKKKALTRRLIAAETLGSVSVICSDKTGTLTRGEMQVTTIRNCFESHELESKSEKTREFFEVSDHAMALKIGYLCNNAHFEDPANIDSSAIIGNPTDVALFGAARASGMDVAEMNERFARKEEIPFDSVKKYMATRNKFDNENDVIYAKGAPEKILNFCTQYAIGDVVRKISSEDRETLKKCFNEMTGSGLRVIAVAYRPIDKKYSPIEDGDLKEMIFTAFIGLKDPVRPEAHETIRRCKMAGIRPVMVTGDHQRTAEAIAREVGFEINEHNVLNGSELDRINDRELEKIIKKIDVYARVEPHHKVRIVDAWQKVGKVVAMTGDGVNDAPALKSADVGVALGSGTDVAKENSDLVLLDSNFKTIVNAVRQGRVIFDNIRKVIVYLLADSFTEMILIFGALVMGLPLPLLPAQILWINLVTDGLPHMALAAEPAEKDVMKLAPRKRKEPLLNQEMKVLIFLIGIITDIGLLALFYYLMSRGADIAYARTIIFAALGIDSLFYAFSCRSLRHTIFTRNPFSNKWLVLAVLGGLGFQLIALYVPFFQRIFQLHTLGWKEWAVVLAIGIIEILVIEITKMAYILIRRRQERKMAMATT